jgi:hypothetical protein
MEIINKKSALKNWRCGACHKLLGIIYRNGILAIKHKDFVGWVLSGDFKTICRFCKCENTYTHKPIQ